MSFKLIHAETLMLSLGDLIKIETAPAHYVGSLTVKIHYSAVVFASSNVEKDEQQKYKRFHETSSDPIGSDFIKSEKNENGRKLKKSKKRKTEEN